MSQITPEKSREWRRKNREKVKRGMVSLRSRYRKRYWAWKATQKCLVCGEGRHWCLVAHHRDPETKTSGLSRMAGQVSWDRLRVELDKCDILCANCHADLHWKLDHPETS